MYYGLLTKREVKIRLDVSQVLFLRFRDRDTVEVYEGFIILLSRRLFLRDTAVSRCGGKDSAIFPTWVSDLVHFAR